MNWHLPNFACNYMLLLQFTTFDRSPEEVNMQSFSTYFAICDLLPSISLSRSLSLSPPRPSGVAKAEGHRRSWAAQLQHRPFGEQRGGGNGSRTSRREREREREVGGSACAPKGARESARRKEGRPPIELG